MTLASYDILTVSCVIFFVAFILKLFLASTSLLYFVDMLNKHSAIKQSLKGEFMKVDSKIFGAFSAIRLLC